MSVRFDDPLERELQVPAMSHRAPRDADDEAADLTPADLDAIQAYVDNEARQTALHRSLGRSRSNVRTTEFRLTVRKPAGVAK